MMDSVWNAFLPRLEKCPGKVSVYCKNLVTGEVRGFQPDLPLVAASVIKLPILGEAFRQAEGGLLSLEEEFSIRQEDKMPSCGALTYLHDGVRVTLRDLCTLMIILSDNTATNLLIDRLGMDGVNAFLRQRGLQKTTLRRRLFDAAASARGLQNTITTGEMGLLLEKMYRGQWVSPKADADMLGILKNQRLNGKIPFFLKDYDMAHKTGEDEGITHDVALVYARQPLVLCFASNETDVPAFERLIQDMAHDLVKAWE